MAAVAPLALWDAIIDLFLPIRHREKLLETRPRKWRENDRDQDNDSGGRYGVRNV